MRGLGAIAGWSYRHRTLVLVVAGLLVAGAVVAARRVRIDTDVSALLPDTFESVRDLERLRTRYGGVGYVAVVAGGAPTEELRRFADELAHRLEGLPTLRSVEVRRADAFLRERALYFVERADLEEVAERLEARHEWEVARQSPFIVTLEEEGPPPVDFTQIERRYAEVTLATSERAPEPYHLSPDGDTVVVLAQPKRLASDLAFAERVVADVQRTVDALQAEGRAPPRVELTGRYKKRVDLQRVLEADLRLASALAALLIGGYLLLHFRRIGALPLLVGPLAAALAWTYGVAGLAFGTLNVLTAFLATILLGIGIDAGIHLLDAVDDARARGDAGVEAVRRAYGRVGFGTLAAGATTLAAFLAIATAELRAFRELGVLAAVGIGFAVLAYVTVLPALLSLRELAPRRRAPVCAPRLGARHLERYAAVVLALGAGLLLASAAKIPRLSFDYDFAHLDDAGLRSYELDREVNRLLGRSQTPLIVLGERPGDAAAAAAVIRERRRRLGEASGVARVVTVADLVPLGQPEKRLVLDRIERLVERVDLTSLDARDRERIDAWRPLLGAEPFGLGDLPRAIQHAFDPDGSGVSETALVFPSVSQSDGLAAVRLARELRGLRLPGGRTISAAGEGMVLADVVESVRADTVRITVAVAVAMLVTLSIALGGLARALAAMVPAAATLVATLGALPVLGLSLDYMNVLVLPILLGMGVDGGAHVVSRWMAGDTMDEVWRRTGRSVAGATLTSMVGFGALLVADHPGLASVGRLAALGLASNLLATLVLLPALLVLAPRPRAVTSPWAFVATLGRVGHARVAPGTLGALFAIPLAVGLAELAWAWRLSIVGGMTVVATVAAHRYAARVGREDPQEVVVDELVGALIALVAVPVHAGWMAAAFLLFRFFDIRKPGPIAIVQQRVHGGLGIVGDDVAAGLAAAAVVGAARWALGV